MSSTNSNMQAAVKGILESAVNGVSFVQLVRDLREKGFEPSRYEVQTELRALKHAAEKQQARLEAAENLLHGIRYNLEHLQVDLEGLALKAMRHTTSLSDMCEDMLADKLGGGYSTNCCWNVGNANKVAAGCLEALGTIRLIMHHFEEGQKTAAKEGGAE